jgi:hypothetical protein
MRVFEERVLRGICGAKGKEVQQVEECCTMSSFMLYNLHKISTY